MTLFFQGEQVIGNRTRAKVVKNKIAPPFKEAEFDIIYGEGISQEGNILDLGVNWGFIEKSGAWYTYKNQRLGQGRENAKSYLKEHPEIKREIEKMIKQKAGLIKEEKSKQPSQKTQQPG